MPRRRSWQSSGAMSDKSESEKLEKGARVAIVSGRQGKGMRGEVFWVGESRYGKGFRYGVRGDDGETYWVDEKDVGPEDAVPAPELPEQKALEKGTRVEITRGTSAGARGEVFWVGESRYGKGFRYGVRADDGETHWVDGPGIEAIEGPPPPASSPRGAPSRQENEFQDPPQESEFQDPPGGFDDAPAGFEEAPASAGFDDAPLPGDDDIVYDERELEDDEPRSDLRLPTQRPWRGISRRRGSFRGEQSVSSRADGGRPRPRGTRYCVHLDDAGAPEAPAAPRMDAGAREHWTRTVGRSEDARRSTPHGSRRSHRGSSPRPCRSSSPRPGSGRRRSSSRPRSQRSTAPRAAEDGPLRRRPTPALRSLLGRPRAAPPGAGSAMPPEVSRPPRTTAVRRRTRPRHPG